MELGADSATPVHIIDRGQVWMPRSGEFEVEVEGGIRYAETSQAIIVPAGAVRRFKAVGGPAGAVVAMALGGSAMPPGSEDRIPLPWAKTSPL
ncbi:cupin [Streptomyces sp. NPDC005017]|uniref:cupin n=1 Tax=Streptomyces sp. NPDC005017 TaxID=3364706 RepID=UPI0036AE49D4